MYERLRTDRPYNDLIENDIRHFDEIARRICDSRFRNRRTSLPHSSRETSPCVYVQTKNWRPLVFLSRSSKSAPFNDRKGCTAGLR